MSSACTRTARAPGLRGKAFAPQARMMWRFLANKLRSVLAIALRALVVSAPLVSLELDFFFLFLFAASSGCTSQSQDTGARAGRIRPDLAKGLASSHQSYRATRFPEVIAELHDMFVLLIYMHAESHRHSSSLFFLLFVDSFNFFRHTALFV